MIEWYDYIWFAVLVSSPALLLIGIDYLGDKIK
jgi:hypothetical protein